MSGLVLGIDLGTTNSVIAVSDGGQSRVVPAPDGRRLWPSVVAFPPSGEVMVGPAARERRLIDAPNTIYSIKRLIGLPFDSAEVTQARQRLPFQLLPGDQGRCVVKVRSGTHTLPEISAFVLRDLRRIAEEFTGEKCERAVVTVPANFNELQRSATKAAGMIAGIEVIRILNEPTAAALAYGYAQRKPERIAVYDLGGGTFDVSILELDQDAFEVVATAGDAFLGGDDVDVVVAEAMADAFLAQHRIDPRTSVQQFERLRAAAEWVKCKLSSEERATAHVSELAHGDRGVPLHLDFAMTRSDLEQRARPLVERSLDVCKKALESASIRPRDIQSVILVGGATRMPLVRKMVRDYFRRQPRTDIDPDLVVAIGAGILGHTLSGRPDVPAGAPGRKPSFTALRRPDLARLRPHEPEVPIPAQPAFAPPEQDAVAVPAARPKRPARPTPPPPVLPNLPEPGAERPRTLEPAPLFGTREGSSAFTLAELEEQQARQLAAKKKPMGGALFGDVEPEPAPARPAVPEPAVAPAPARFQKPKKPSIVEDLDFLDPDAPADRPAPAAAAVSAPPDALGVDDILFVEDAPAEPAPPPLIKQLPNAAEIRDVLGLEPLPASRARPAPEAAPAPSPGRNAPAQLDPLELDPLGEPAPVIPVVDLPAGPAPLLMDVTPHSLGIEMAGGHCSPLIKRNVPIPAEQVRVFTTARDDQDSVVVRICQGEARRFAENQLLGEIELTGLARAPRGVPKIQISFILDASGTLESTAIDLDTGRTQTIRINLLGGYDPGELDALRRKHEKAWSSGAGP